MAAVCHLGFLKLEITTSGPVRSHDMRLPAKFCKDWSNRSGEPFRRYGRFSIFQDGAILDWFYACWDHPLRVLGGLCDCAKFGCNQCSKIDSVQILIFCELSLKMPWSDFDDLYVIRRVSAQGSAFWGSHLYCSPFLG